MKDWSGATDDELRALAERKRRARVSSSLYPQGQGVEAENYSPSPCRVTLIQRRKDDPSRGRLIAQPCDQKDCPDCGPVYRQRKTEFYSELLVDVQLYEVTVASADWRALYKRIAKRGGNYFNVPVANDCFRVLTSAEVGDPVESIAAVTRAFGDMEVDGGRSGRRVTASKDWREPKEERPEAQWETVFESPLSLPATGAVLATLEIPANKVAYGWTFTLPGGRVPRALSEALEARRPRRSRRRLSRAAREALGLAA